MGAPAVLIVVRHGARLDAADKQWHLSSPTPYDPPLTYGGWLQAQSLGARIASILRSRETDDDIPDIKKQNDQGGDRRRRRHKVILHSSPFLRCIQTSTAISAGLAENPGHTHSTTTSPRPGSAQSHRGLHSSPQLRPTVFAGSPKLVPIIEPSNASSKVLDGDKIRKSVLRIDPFLGEWLSPEYFDQITPPPSSVMMVASAKAELLRREDHERLIHARDIDKKAGGAHNQGFPGGWGSPVISHSAKDKEDGPLSSMSSIGHALRERTSSMGSSRYSGKNVQLNQPSEHGIYQPPIPSYSISSSDAIPPGYVSHARDACLDIDYQWDSMREPLNWGDGGELGEEWSSMHKRFRRGLQNMVASYKDTDNPEKLVTKKATRSAIPEYFPEQEDDDADLVVILVTHGAGCNALIGAITNQPVLMDVGVASLTMAVRRETPKESGPLTPRSRSPVSSRIITISEDYDVKLLANTEHLRSSAGTPISSRAPMGNIMLPIFRERQQGAVDAMTYGRPLRSSSVSSSLGSIRRTNSSAKGSPKASGLARQNSIGLWSANKSQDEEEDDNMYPSYGDDSREKSPPATEKAIPTEEAVEDDQVAPLGLWGSSRIPTYETDKKEFPPKRRWTVHERS